MFWNHKPSGEELLAAYLDPSVEWSAEQDQQLRQWVRSSPEAQDAYDKRVIAHRILLGLDGDTPSRVERDRMMSATIAQSVAPSSAKVGWLRLDILIPVGAMALVAMIALPVLQDAPLPLQFRPNPSTLSPSDSTDYLGTGAETTAS